MKNLIIGKSDMNSSSIVLGCMRINKMSQSEIDTHILTAVSEGITLFDHADIYGNGECEELFGNVLLKNRSLREKIQIQTKCSIRDGYYDMSKEHILDSVDKSLKRLKTEYLDLLIMHRPDTLMEPYEVSEAFDILYKSGKVRNFGVSNFNSMQIELLKKHVKYPLLVNQLQFSIMHTGMVDSGIQANSTFSGSVDHDGSILEYCRLNDITIQAWSPFQYGFFEGVFLDNDKFPELNKTMDKIAEEKNISKTALAVSWILTHPANMQTIVGTTNTQRLKDICTADKVTLSRKEWYEIYKAAGNIIP